MSIAAIALMIGSPLLALSYGAFLPVIRRTIREAAESGEDTDIAQSFEYMTASLLSVALFLLVIVVVPLAFPAFAASDLYGVGIVLGLLGSLLPPLYVLWRIFGKEN